MLQAQHGPAEPGQLPVVGGRSGGWGWWDGRHRLQQAGHEQVMREGVEDGLLGRMAGRIANQLAIKLAALVAGDRVVDDLFPSRQRHGLGWAGRGCGRIVPS